MSSICEPGGNINHIEASTNDHCGCDQSPWCCPRKRPIPAQSPADSESTWAIRYRRNISTPTTGEVNFNNLHLALIQAWEDSNDPNVSPLQVLWESNTLAPEQVLNAIIKAMNHAHDEGSKLPTIHNS